MSRRNHSRAAAQALKAHGVTKTAEQANLQKLLPFLIATAFVMSGFLFLFARGL